MGVAFRNPEKHFLGQVGCTFSAGSFNQRAVPLPGTIRRSSSLPAVTRVRLPRLVWLSGLIELACVALDCVLVWSGLISPS